MENRRVSGRCHFLVKEMSAHSRRPSVSERPPAIPRFAWCPRFAPRFWARTWAKENPRHYSERLLSPASRGPLRFDLYDPNLPKRIMAVAAPLPILKV